MDYFSLGSEISYPNYNALVYLLRKFKRLTSDLRLGSNSISSDYGTYNVTGGLTSVGGNFILEDDVTISSSDVLLNCFYTFHFTVVDVNLSGTVNRRVVSVTGDTGDDGVLEVVLEPSLLESDEVILPDFKVDIVFDEHEYYTPVSALDITLTVDKEYITVGETATVTATVLDDTDSPVEDLELQFNFNGDIVTDVTDSSGVASAEYTGTGVGWVTVIVSGESIRFYDGCMVATVTGDSIQLGEIGYRLWLGTVGDVIIDWGDGTTNTVNNPRALLTHNYNDGLSEHNITFYGEVTSLGYGCFYKCTGLTSIFIPISVTNLGEECFLTCTGLTSVTIPEGVTSLGKYCFSTCTALTSVSIPNSITSLGKSCFLNCRSLTSVGIPYNVTSIGDDCFTGCTSLIDYELYWTGDNIITYDSNKMPNNTNSVFTIPIGETTNYVAKNYPSNKLVERGTHTYSLSIASDKSSILTSESVTISGTLLMDSSPYASQSIQLYDGSTLIDTLTTDSNGEYSKTISGLTAGTHTFKAVNTNAESTTVSVTVTEPTPVHDYSLTVTGTAIIQTGDTDNITATLKDNGVVVSGETLNYQIKHGNTIIDSGTGTTDNNGQITISYTGTGVGDVDVIVSYGSLLQETYEVTDYIRYDDATTDKTSNYQYNNLNSHTFSTDKYIAQRTTGTSPASTYYSPIYPSDTLPTNYEISVDMLAITKEQDKQFGLCISNEYTQTYSGTNQCFLYGNTNRMALGYRVNGSLTNYGESSSYNTNTWYTFKITVNGTSVTTQILNGDTVVQSWNGTLSNIQSWKKIMIITGGEANTVYWKNLKIKALSFYDLSVTASDDIIQNGDTTTLTATLIDNSVPVTGETLSYQIKHGNTVISSGSDTTDNNGQISISYTGTGVGNVSVIVSYGSLLQETYEVKDVFFYDNARTGQKNSNWTKSSDQLTVTTADDGTTVSATSNNEYLTNTGLTGDFKVTLKTYVTGNTVRLVLKDGNGNYTRALSITTDRTVYYEITRVNGVCSAKYSYDEVTWYNRSIEMDNATSTVKFGIGILFPSSGGTRALKYSDLIIEPI